MRLLDRDHERDVIEEAISAGNPGAIRLLQIDGPTGVGKTDLLRYAASLAASSNIAFRFEDDLLLHKCRKGDQAVEFSLLTPLIGALSLRHPQAFASATSESIRSLPIQPIAQMALHVAGGVPYLKGAAKAYEVETAEFARSKTRLLSLARDSHVLHTLSQFIANAIKEDHPTKRVVFALDDVEWADLLSLRTLLSASRRLARASFDVLILCTSNATRNDDETTNLNDVESAFHDFSEATVNRLDVGNLSREQTRQVVGQYGKHLISEEIDFLYVFTSGNFADLMRLLRQREDKIRLLYNNWRTETVPASPISSNDLWLDHLASLLSRNPRLRYVFGVLVALENVVFVDELRHLYPRLAGGAEGRAMSRTELATLLEPTAQTGDIQVVGDYVIADKRALDAARTIFLQDGSFTDSARCIASAYRLGELGEVLGWPEDLARSVSILATVDPEDALRTFAAALPRLRGAPTVPTSLLLSSASAFRTACSGDVDGPTVELGAELVRLLTHNSTFQAGAEVGHVVYARRQWLGDASLQRFLSDYLKCLREAGRLRDDRRDLGREVVDELIRKSHSAERLADALLVASTVFEHLADYEAIRSAYERLQATIREIGDKNTRRRFEIAYARNLGLYRFHGDLIKEYESALELLSTLPSTDLEPTSDRASLLNHIGLGHYHAGRVMEAVASFRESLTQLDTLGKRFETPLNNLGACLLIEGQLGDALEYFEQARDVAIKPRYQTMSIDINFSVCVFKLGHEEMAVSTLRPIADGQREAPDPAIVSHAQANLAYCLMEQGKFAAAADYYARSNTHRFRFLTQERAAVRQLLARYCAARAGILSGEDLGDMSFVDLDETQHQPSRRAYQLDLNSLYIF